MRVAIVTVDGTELVSLLLKHSNNELYQDETIDYQRVCANDFGKSVVGSFPTEFASCDHIIYSKSLFTWYSLSHSIRIDDVTLSVDVDVLEDSAAKTTSGWSLCGAVNHGTAIPCSHQILCLSSNTIYPRRSIRSQLCLLELRVFN